MANKKTSKRVTKTECRPFVICRCSGAGVHAGELGVEENGRLTLHNSRRVWRFMGAQTLSELAVYGANSDSKIAPVVAVIQLRSDDVHEIIHCQPAGERFIRESKEWRA